MRSRHTIGAGLVFLTGSILLATLASGADNAPATPAAEQIVQIESVLRPGWLLRVQDARREDGVPLVLYPREAWRCMTWRLDTDGDGLRLMNQFTSKTFGPATQPADAANPSPTTSPATQVLLKQHRATKTPALDEAFRFDPVEGQDGVYTIRHLTTGLNVEAVGDDTVMLRPPSSNAAGQRWRLLAKPERYTG